MEEEQKRTRHYKVEAGDTIVIERVDVKEYTFYKVSLPKRINENQVLYFKKPILLPAGDSLPDGTRILVKDFFEEVRENPKDKYNPIWQLRILDYEIIEDTPSNDIISEYNEMMSENSIDFSEYMEGNE